MADPLLRDLQVSETEGVRWAVIQRWLAQIAATSASGVNSILGTAGQITASSPTGVVTLSLPTALVAPGTLTVVSTVTAQGVGTHTFGTTNTVSFLAGVGTFNAGRPVVIDGLNGFTSVRGSGGGWVIGHKFLGSAGTVGGGLWATGGTDTLGDINIGGGNFATAWATFTLGQVTITGSLKARSATAISGGGALGSGLMLSTTAFFGIFFGSGAPTLSAAQGSIYLRSDGTGPADRLYVNVNGTTGWTNFVSAT